MLKEYCVELRRRIGNISYHTYDIKTARKNLETLKSYKNGTIVTMTRNVTPWDIVSERDFLREET